MDMETRLLWHQKCFEQVDGVTRFVLYDNMKTVTIDRDSRNRPIWHPRFLDFAISTGFSPGSIGRIILEQG